MTRLTKDERERHRLEPTAYVAYHEAGHAAAAIWHGRALRRVTIVPDKEEGSLGHVARRKRRRQSFDPENQTLDDARYQTRLIRGILIALAGPAAEERFTGRPNPHGAGGDMEYVVELACRACPDDNERMHFVGWLKVRTRRFVARPPVWIGIEAIAGALLERRTMSAREVKEVWRAAHRDWTPKTPGS
jgi:ATP-dependent Zn protease